MIDFAEPARVAEIEQKAFEARIHHALDAMSPFRLTDDDFRYEAKIGIEYFMHGVLLPPKHVVYCEPTIV